MTHDPVWVMRGGVRYCSRQLTAVAAPKRTKVYLPLQVVSYKFGPGGGSFVLERGDASLHYVKV